MWRVPDEIVSMLRLPFCLFVFSLLLTFFSILAEARLPNESDMNAKIDYERMRIDVANDGTYVIDFEAQVAVLTEAGRDGEALRNVGFNSRSTKFELLWAKTINGDKETPVDKSAVEIKEVGDSKVFDSMKQALISFPAVQVGSKLRYRFKQTVHEVPNPGFFSWQVGLEMVNSDKLDIVVSSSKPLFHSFQDPLGVFDVASRVESGKHIVQIKNKAPVYFGVVQEDYVYVDSRRMPSIVIATAPTWDGFAKEILVAQEKEIAKPLPPVMRKIADAAKSEPVARRMAFVAAGVAKEFRYFGDWRRRNGGHLPRSLQEIADTGYGDCKDMSLVVVAIARAMGLKADIAWIWRGEGGINESIYRLPTELGFNHAIARVEDDGVQWIDATNPVALPRAVYADIAARPVLVMEASGVRLETTPPLDSKGATAVLKQEIEFLRDQKVRLRGSLAQTGRSAVKTEWALSSIPREQFDYEISRWMVREEKLIAHKVEAPADPSRIARDITIQADLTVASVALKTTAGFGFPLLRNETIDYLLVDTRDRFSDIWLGMPNRLVDEYLLRGKAMVGSQSLDCDLKSEWLNLKRKISQTAAGVKVVNEIEVKKIFIPNDRFKSAEFQKFHSRARECFYRSAIILSSLQR